MESQWMRQVTRKRRRTLTVSISRTSALDVMESQRPASCSERWVEAPIWAEQATLMESISLRGFTGLSEPDDHTVQKKRVAQYLSALIR